MRHVLSTALAVALLAGCAASPQQDIATGPAVRTAMFAGEYLDLAACSHTRLEEVVGHQRVQLLDLGTHARIVVRTASDGSPVYELDFTPSGDRVAVAMRGPERTAEIVAIWREVETCARLGKW